MKKVIIVLTALLMSAVLAVSVYAEQSIVKLEDTTSQPGHTFFLKVSVTESLAGDTMGISYSYDEKVLEVVPESCKWEKAGILQDFSKNDTAGVWATGEIVDLYGTVCVLAFRVRSNAKPVETKVSCTLTVKSGAEEVGKFQTGATVTIVCDHVYGAWESNGDLVHQHVCGICEDTQNQPHSWDRGTVKVREDKQTDLMVYKCSVCGGTKESEIPKQSEGTKETQGNGNSGPTQSTQPSAPIPTVTRPTHPTEDDHDHDTRPSSRPTQPSSSRPTQPSSNRPTQSSGNGGNTSNNTQQGQTGNPNSGQQDTHNQGSVGTMPHDHENGEQISPVPSDGHTDHEHTQPSTQDPHAGHDHGNEMTVVSSDKRLITAAGIFLVLGLALGGCSLLAKRRRR